jgi:hypothetical protein
MDGGSLPTYRVLSLPPIGRALPRGSLPQAARTLAVMALGLGWFLALMAGSGAHQPPQRAPAGVERA